MKQYIIALGLGMVLFLGGCGSQEAIDTYSFGQKVINVGQSEVIVDSPFDFGQLDRIVANDKGQPLTIYAGLDKNYGVYVSATQASTGAPLPTLEEGTKLAQQELAKELGGQRDRSMKQVVDSQQDVVKKVHQEGTQLWNAEWDQRLAQKRDEVQALHDAILEDIRVRAGVIARAKHLDLVLVDHITDRTGMDLTDEIIKSYGQ